MEDLHNDLAEWEPETIEVWEPVRQRVSALLGPDGKPLRIDLERPAVGFDLRRQS